MRRRKKYYKKSFANYLKVLDEKVGDFEENAIPKVTLHEDCKDDVYELDMRCTDYGEAMDFFN